MRSERAVLILLLRSFVVAISDNETEYKDSKLVVTTQGPVRGYRDPEGLFVFFNIPYATAPTGPDKFKAPLPPPTWLEPLEAVDRGIVCPQSAITVEPDMVEQEDCLIANVFVPDTEETNLPVVVYIHGGSYVTGCGDTLTPKHVVRRKKVIVVTINFRLGVIGFLCLGTQDVPGNAALKDIVAALHWVNKNIAAFAGNPNDVTLAGYSSGASLTDLLTLYPATNGLFSKAVIDSSVTGKTNLVMDPINNARILAVYLGFNDSHDVYALEEFYKLAPMKTLTKDAADYLGHTKETGVLFAPCIERSAEDEDKKIVTETPFNILKNGSYKHIPILYGFTNMEGIFFTMLFNKLHQKDMNDNFSEYLPNIFQFKNREEKEKVANALKKLYFGDKPVSNDTILEYTEYYSDMYFKIPMFKIIQMRLASGQDEIYLYQYSFVDDNVPVLPHTNTRGAKHNDIARAVLDDSSNEDNITNAYKEMKGIMREIWANFVKTSSPAPPGSGLPAWPPVGPGLTPFMDVTLSPQLVWEWDQTWHERMRFWDSLYELYYHQEPISLPEPTTRERMNEIAQEYLKTLLVADPLTRERQNITSLKDLEHTPRPETTTKAGLNETYLLRKICSCFVILCTRT